MPSPETPRVGYVVKMYPRLAETFILNEILAHEQSGLELEVFSRRMPADGRFHCDLGLVRAQVTYLPGPSVKAEHFWTALGRARTTRPHGPRVLEIAEGADAGNVHQAIALAEAFLQCRLPGAGVLVTGPLMPAENRRRLQTLAAGRPLVRVLEFVTDPCPLFERADRVIAMGGYNTICEIMAFGKRALIVPRVQPRTEQLIRAECFAQRGLLDMLHPDDLGPSAISSWIEGIDSRPSVVEPAIDLGGVARLPILLDEILAAQRSETEPIHATR